MRLEYIGLSELSGSLIALEGVQGVAYDEMAEITLDDGQRRSGRVILVDGDRVVLQVFEGAKGISLETQLCQVAGGALSRGAAEHQRRRHQPGVPAVSPQLHLHRHLRH